jgi:hypothetical protein
MSITVRHINNLRVRRAWWYGFLTGGLTAAVVFGGFQLVLTYLP